MRSIPKLRGLGWARVGKGNCSAAMGGEGEDLLREELSSRIVGGVYRCGCCVSLRGAFGVLWVVLNRGAGAGMRCFLCQIWSFAKTNTTPTVGGKKNGVELVQVGAKIFWHSEGSTPRTSASTLLRRWIWLASIYIDSTLSSLALTVGPNL